ncbi:hypothetical protein JRO89_XS06G0067300 [Xanthoceras sorbifolium]|uniref:Uncharacterized protein n=1 Tax=Xanthoceras sorbifolium TaxID=99658 RepID=A0ABQ8HXC4_9ROSI|nr:hypothetical protein JRO89_XS06G0067300 [Xanthoceras sorbifolium]
MGILTCFITDFVSSSFLVRALRSLKNSLGLPHRFGWNGDPCVPQQHPWNGADCQLDRTTNKWVIDGLYLTDPLPYI